MKIQEHSGLRWCGTCGCVWAADWPYDRCEDDDCWCEKQPDPFWHAQVSDYDADESESLSGSEEETQKLPLLE